MTPALAVILCLAGAAAPAQDQGDNNDPTQNAIVPLEGDWRPANMSTALPERENLGCVGSDDCAEGKQHGTYVNDPYFRVIDLGEGRFRMISDGFLDVALAAHGEGTNHFRIAGTMGRIVVNAAKDCVQDYPCMEVSGLTEEDTGKSGLAELPNGTYVRPPQQAADPNLTQTLGDNFAPIPANFDTVRRCYDSTKIDGEDFTESGCEQNIFAGIGVGSKRYTPMSDAHEKKLGIPFGWKWQGLSGGWGQSYANMISSERDLTQSHMSKTGWKTGVNLVIVDFSVQHNETMAKRTEQMYSQQKQFSEFDYTELAFALVLDKWNATLSEEFQNGVRALVKYGDTDGFIKTWGTHYAFATTMGERGYLISTMDSSQMLELHAQEVSVSDGASGGITIPLQEFDIPGNVGVSGKGDSGRADSHALRMNKILQSDMGSYRCFGGMSCNGRTASGSDAVVPIFLDLRPISDLLGPPFFPGLDGLVETRDTLRKAIATYSFTGKAARNKPPMSFASVQELTFLQLESNYNYEPDEAKRISQWIAQDTITEKLTVTSVDVEINGSKQTVAGDEPPGTTIFQWPAKPETSIKVTDVKFEIAGYDCEVRLDPGMAGKDLVILYTPALDGMDGPASMDRVVAKFMAQIPYGKQCERGAVSVVAELVVPFAPVEAASFLNARPMSRLQLPD
jgi:hypothetical protein